MSAYRKAFPRTGRTLIGDDDLQLIHIYRIYILQQVLILLSCTRPNSTQPTACALTTANASCLTHQYPSILCRGTKAIIARITTLELEVKKEDVRPMTMKNFDSKKESC